MASIFEVMCQRLVGIFWQEIIKLFNAYFDVFRIFKPKLLTLKVFIAEPADANLEKTNILLEFQIILKLMLHKIIFPRKGSVNANKPGPAQVGAISEAQK